MELILMCKEKKILNVNTMLVYNHALLPGLLSKAQNPLLFMDWFRKRYSERSNTASRQLRGLLFGQGNRDVIDKTTHALSLSDCYWIKTENDTAKFAEISPYYSKFWTGEGDYEGEAIPTLYVNGFLTKYWKNRDTLIKKSDEREVVCSNLAKDLGIIAVDVYKHGDDIAVRNFTNDNIMFESAEASGKIDPENFTTEDILNIFGESGFDMLFFDALIGNGDRHAGNFGFLRDADTGEYISAAPLFDFDHAYDSKSVNDILIAEIKSLKFSQYKQRCAHLIKKANNSAHLNDYIKERLQVMDN